MNLHCLKLLCFFFTMFSLTGCKESTDMPPFTLCLDIKLINENGSLPLKENKDKINDIIINLLNPINTAAKVASISYLDYPNCLRMQIAEWGANLKNNGNYEQEYIMEINYPKEIREKIDVLKIKVQFKDKVPSIVNAYYNNQEAQYIGLDIIYFEIKNKL